MRLSRFAGGALVLALLSYASRDLRGEQNVVISGSVPTLENREMPKGTGLIMGRALEAESKSAIAGAIVYLQLASGAAPDPAMTDEQGRFVFRDLPKGEYTLRSVRAGYVAGAYAKRLPDEEPGRDGRPLALADDERIGDVILTMWKHAAIAGTVVDELGEPVVGVTVRAVPRRIVAGRSQYDLDYTSVGDRTDDRGFYRLSSLIPGDYLLALPNITGSLPKQRLPASPAAGPSSLTESSTGGLRWTTGGGSLRTGGIDVGDADYLFVAGGASFLRVPGFAGVTADGKVLGYETQFYPGVTTIARATHITLRSGEEHRGIDFQLRAVPTVRVSGTVVGVGGPPGELMLRLVSAETAAMLVRDPEIAQTVCTADGRFTFLGVPPGDYAIRISRTSRPVTSTDPASTVVQTGGGSSSVRILTSESRVGLPDTPTLWADVPVSVGAQDIGDVTVPLRTGLRVKGRIEFESASHLAPPLDRFSTVYIERADGVESVNTGLMLGRVDGQGNFSTYGQAPGKYFVRMPYPVANWTFKGAMLGDRDLSIVPLELTDADVADVVLKFTDAPPAEINGAVRNDRGQPDETATVIVFPSNRQFWTNRGANPRNLHSVGTGKDGKYRVTPLPAGDYFVAVSPSANAAWADPANLDALAKSAIRVQLKDGDKRVQDLVIRRRSPEPDVESRVEFSGHGPWIDDAQTQAPAREAAVAPQVGTALISGVVVTSGERPEPVRRAQVTLGGGAALGGSRVVVTDATGRFEFTRLPAGRYSLSASKPAFLTTNYGARQPGRPGISINVTDGQKASDLRLSLVRGAVIAGTIRDEHGQPLNGATMEVLRYRTVNGERRLQRYGLGETTDDRGTYRFFELEPGDYVVAASMRSMGGNARVTTEAEWRSALQTLQRTAGRGGAVAARPATVSFAPVFYPGTADAANATSVTVRAEEERTGVDFAFQLVPTARVEGTVVNPAGPLPPNTEVRVVNVRPAGLGYVDFGLIFPLKPRPDGTFMFSGLVPGQYALAATTTGAAGGRGRGAASGDSLWATAELAINGTDVTNVVLTLQPGMTVSGTVSFNATSLAAPSQAGTRVTLTPILTGSEISVGQLTATSAPDGSFTLSGVMPGRYFVRALPPTGTPGWLMRSAVVGGRDTADDGLDVRAGENVSGIAITFSDRPGELTGVLQDATGRAAPDYFIILFAADKAHWRTGTRRIQQARPSTDGRFTFRNLLPGDYCLAAVTDVESGEWFDPAFLAQLVGGSITLAIAEGEKKTQDIRIAR
jgi:uncharacterized protein (DUF2141 family)